MAPPRSEKRPESDLLASVGAQLTRAMQANAFVQWSPERERSQRLSPGVRWQPRPMSVLGLYYRYNWNQDPEKPRFQSNRSICRLSGP